MSKRFSFLLITCALICSSHAGQDFDNPEVWQKTYTQAKQDFPEELTQYIESHLGLGKLLGQNLEESFMEHGFNAVLEEGWEEVGPRVYHYQSFLNEGTMEDAEIEAILKSPIDWSNIDAIAIENGLFQVCFERTGCDKNLIPCEHLCVTRTFRYNVPSFGNTHAQ